jgi:hypothetical protein
MENASFMWVKAVGFFIFSNASLLRRLAEIKTSC